jgi:hypothetical protein
MSLLVVPITADPPQDLGWESPYHSGKQLWAEQDGTEQLMDPSQYMALRKRLHEQEGQGKTGRRPAAGVGHSQSQTYSGVHEHQGLGRWEMVMAGHDIIHYPLLSPHPCWEWELCLGGRGQRDLIHHNSCFSLGIVWTVCLKLWESFKGFYFLGTASLKHPELTYWLLARQWC